MARVSFIGLGVMGGALAIARLVAQDNANVALMAQCMVIRSCWLP